MFVAVIVLLFPTGEVTFVTSEHVLDSPAECEKTLYDMISGTKELVKDALMFPVCAPITNTRGL